MSPYHVISVIMIIFARKKLFIPLITFGLFVTLLTYYTPQETSKSTSRLKTEEYDLLLLTVASGESINLRRLVRSADIHGVPLKVLGQGRQWKGLGQKISVLKEELRHLRCNSNQIILFADAYDSLINARAVDIKRKFLEINSQILFAAEHNCVPDLSLCPKYPPPETGKKYLNSGLFIGFAPNLYRLLTIAPFPDEGNDQLYFTQVFLNKTLRHELNFTLDYRCKLFQTDEGGPNIIDILFEGRNAYLYNRDYQTTPQIIHTPGYLKPYINNIANFLPNVWNPIDGCTACLENSLNLSTTLVNNFPRILIAAFIEGITPEIEVFFHRLVKLKYPTEKIDFILYNSVAHYGDLIEKFELKYGRKYNSFVSRPLLKVNASSKNEALEECAKHRCDYYLSVDSTVHLTNPLTLQRLVEQNRTVVAPLLFGPDRKSNNFVAFEEPEYFIPAFEGAGSKKRRGLWNVFAVTSCILVRSDIILNPETRPSYSHPDHQDPDIAFSSDLNIHEIDLYLTNREDFGILVTPGRISTCTIFSCGYSP